MSTATPDSFGPSANWQTLRLRSQLLAQTRAFFAARNFLEVETPQLSAEVVVDRHLDPLRVTLPPDPRRPDVGPTYYLQTSPEFGMKRLMAAGGEAIYQIARVFRGGEIGPRHNPEFTMVEWYRRGDTMNEGMALLSDLANALLGLGPAEELSYAEAFQRFAGIDPHRASVTELAAAGAGQGIAMPQSLSADDRDAWLDVLLVELVEPHLGANRPTILYDYPASQAALARVRESDPPVAERFELYVRGIELANGYHELLDPAVLRRRNASANQLRVADGKPALPEESRLLAAMDCGLPACSGTALGFDRLVMIAAGASHVSEVMAFPIDRA